MALYSYVLRIDDGAAPNPYGGVCTLTICKPAIRRTAQVGDWIIGTGSKNAPNGLGDLNRYLVYAMQVTLKLTLAEYDTHCRQHLPIKVPGMRPKLKENVVGDCIYDYSDPHRATPAHRGFLHTEQALQQRDWRGENALLSTHFYYFGAEPRELPPQLLSLVKKGQGHYRRTNSDDILDFEQWLAGQPFTLNHCHADPQLILWQKPAPSCGSLLANLTPLPVAACAA